MMTTDDRERLHAIERVFRAETAMKQLIEVLPADLARKIDLARIEAVLDEETTGLVKEYERLDARAAAETPNAAAAPALALHDAIVGEDRLHGHAIVVAERRESGTAEQAAALQRIHEELKQAGQSLGGEADTIVIVGGEDCEDHASAIIAGFARADDEYAAVLIDATRSSTATVVSNEMTGLKIGERVRYAVGARWTAGQYEATVEAER